MPKKTFNSVLLWRFHEYGVVHVMSDLDIIILENDIDQDNMSVSLVHHDYI